MKFLTQTVKIEDTGKWLLPDLNTTTIILVSVLLVFTGLVVIVRIAGLRTFAKMTSFDFATTIAIGSILASISIDPKTSIGNGMVALAAIVLFQIFFAYVQRKSKLFKKVATNQPVLLMRDGKILHDNLKACNLDESELIAKLREANVMKFSQVQAAIFESTGDVSVLHNSGESSIELEDRLLDFMDN
ncbi:MAG: YetF domain-containing protein [Nonlabens sp.]